MRRCGFCYVMIISLCVMIGCAESPKKAEGTPPNIDLTGAWRAKVQFTTGAFASINDLEFMYAFNSGGTLMESSNYDAAPPVPPAYGVWKPIGNRRFVAHYEFYMTRPPDSADHVAAGSVWLPAGHGVLVDSISVADDGLTFTSRVHLDMFDQTGKLVEGGGDGTGNGFRIEF